MKTTVKIILLALIGMTVACSKSNDDNVNPSPSNNKVDKVSGNWTVSYYTDSGKDETNDYSGYQFAFGLDGTLSVAGGGGTFSGQWWVGNKSSDDDISSNRLNVVISGNKAMDNLQKDWVILKLTDTEIWLQDDNSSSMEEIHFTRTSP